MPGLRRSEAGSTFIRGLEEEGMRFRGNGKCQIDFKRSGKWAFSKVQLGSSSRTAAKPVLISLTQHHLIITRGFS